MHLGRPSWRRIRVLRWAAVALAAGFISAGALAVPAAGRSRSISRSRADAIALRALGTKDLAGLVAVLRSPAPLPTGAAVGAWSMTPRMATVRLRHPAWLFWEDLEYGAEFAHPSQILLVDAGSGRVVAHMYLTMWPLVNGRAPSLVPATPGGAARRYVVYSSAPPSETAAADDVPVAGLPAFAAANKISHADFTHDCLITIGDRRLTEGFNNDFSAIGSWAGRYGLDRARAAPSPAGLEKAVYEFLTKGCTDFLIYVAGHGRYPKGGKVDGVPDHYGQFAPPPGDYPGFDTPGIGLAAPDAPEGNPPSFLTPADVSRLISEFTKPGKVTIDGEEHELTEDQVKNVGFKLKLQTCYAGWFAQVLLKDQGITPGDHKANPLLLVETSSAAAESSWGYLLTAFVLENGAEVPKQNPRKVSENEKNSQPSEATYANVQGLTTWAENPTSGRTLVQGLTQSFQNGVNVDFTRQIGWTHPQLLGPDFNLGTPDPTTATTSLTTHKLPTRQQGGTPNYTCVGPVYDDVFNNWNGGAVANDGTPPTYTAHEHWCVVSINDYHWNNGLGATPGTIRLKTGTGTLGPYDAVGSTGSPSQTYPNGVPDANWTATPSARTVIDGPVTCIDSDPATWSQNPASGGEGFCKIYVQAAQLNGSPAQ